jgi:hypothetical protein
MYCNISLANCTDVANSFVLSKVGEKALGLPGKIIVDIGIGTAQVNTS